MGRGQRDDEYREGRQVGRRMEVPPEKAVRGNLRTEICFKSKNGSQDEDESGYLPGVGRINVFFVELQHLLMTNGAWVGEVE